MLVHELIGNFYLQKQSRRIDLVRRPRFLMLARLHEVRTIAGTVESDLALLAAALRTNTSVNSGAKALLFADFTDGAAQSSNFFSIMTFFFWMSGNPKRLMPSARRVSIGSKNLALITIM